MKILVADKFEAWGLDQLKALGAEVVSDPSLKDESLSRRVAEFDPGVLIVRSTKVTRDVLRAGRNLRAVIRAGSGYDTIDVEAASELGVTVSNCPGLNASAVAELTIGLIISLDRRIPDNVADFRAGKWNKKKYSAAALGLKGRTIGIIGAGRIGTLVARAAISLDMNVLYYHLGRQRRLIDFPNAVRAELNDLLRQSDVISVHIPGGPSTKNLIDAERIALMKPTALLINTSRGGIIDEEALAAALREGRLRGAALDVYANEPPANAEEFLTPLSDVPHLYGTHHIGASTKQAQLAVAEEVVRLVREYKRTGEMPNCVNFRQTGEQNPMLVVRLRNKPGGLAHVFAVLSEADINVEEMDHVIYDGGAAACAHIRINRRPDEATCAKITDGHENVLGVEILDVD
ncbi:MAG: hypothetical protein D6744_06400 [Planctomycetota bacterium]|nr:MAG: hypothetical protein D6744_06400 [Planctomycetota bacterium]